jgi:hypothetical protein
MTKQFTLLQLFNIVDGRISTSIDDVYDILNHVSNDDLPTIGLTVVQDRLLANKPDWFIKAERQINAIKAGLCSNTFETVVGAIKDKYNDIYDIPQL